MARGLAGWKDSVIFAQFSLSERSRSRRTRKHSKFALFRMVSFADYVDWLGKIKTDGGELAWIRGRPSSQVNQGRRTREKLIAKVLNSLNVKVYLRTPLTTASFVYLRTQSSPWQMKQVVLNKNYGRRLTI